MTEYYPQPEQYFDQEPSVRIEGLSDASSEYGESPGEALPAPTEFDGTHDQESLSETAYTYKEVSGKFYSITHENGEEVISEFAFVVQNEEQQAALEQALATGSSSEVTWEQEITNNTGESTLMEITQTIVIDERSTGKYMTPHTSTREIVKDEEEEPDDSDDSTESDDEPRTDDVNPEHEQGDGSEEPERTDPGGDSATPKIAESTPTRDESTQEAKIKSARAAALAAFGASATSPESTDAEYSDDSTSTDLAESEGQKSHTIADQAPAGAESQSGSEIPEQHNVSEEGSDTTGETRDEHAAHTSHEDQNSVRNNSQSTIPSSNETTTTSEQQASPSVTPQEESYAGDSTSYQPDNLAEYSLPAEVSGETITRTDTIGHEVPKTTAVEPTTAARLDTHAAEEAIDAAKPEEAPPETIEPEEIKDTTTNFESAQELTTSYTEDRATIALGVEQRSATPPITEDTKPANLDESAPARETAQHETLVSDDIEAVTTTSFALEPSRLEGFVSETTESVAPIERAESEVALHDEPTYLSAEAASVVSDQTPARKNDENDTQKILNVRASEQAEHVITLRPQKMTAHPTKSKKIKPASRENRKAKEDTADFNTSLRDMPTPIVEKDIEEARGEPLIQPRVEVATEERHAPAALNSETNLSEQQANDMDERVELTLATAPQERHFTAEETPSLEAMRAALHSQKEITQPVERSATHSSVQLSRGNQFPGEYKARAAQLYDHVSAYGHDVEELYVDDQGNLTLNTHYIPRRKRSTASAKRATSVVR